MIKFFLILTAVLFAGVLLLFFFWRSEKTKRKETQGKLESTNRELARAIMEQAKLESTVHILRENRKEADEKINNLHDGDALGNALDELRKRKN